MLHSAFKIRDENEVGLAPPSVVKRTGGGGLGGVVKRVGLVDSTPLKPGSNSNSSTLTATGSKSTRKALGDLSSSQVNARLATPAPATTKKVAATQFKQESSSVSLLGLGNGMGVGIGSTKKACNSSTKPAPSSSSKPAAVKMLDLRATGPGLDYEDMICSHISKDEDPYDFVLRKASNLKFVVGPSTCESVLDSEAASVSEWQDVPVDFFASDTATGEGDEYELPADFLIECVLEP